MERERDRRMEIGKWKERVRRMEVYRVSYNKGYRNRQTYKETVFLSSLARRERREKGVSERKLSQRERERERERDRERETEREREKEREKEIEAYKKWFRDGQRQT